MTSKTDPGAPTLLAMFAFGTVAVVGVVVAVARSHTDLADAGAIVLVIAVAALIGVAILRQLGDDEDD
jgi:hypothetical protein